MIARPKFVMKKMEDAFVHHLVTALNVNTASQTLGGGNIRKDVKPVIVIK